MSLWSASLETGAEVCQRARPWLGTVVSVRVEAGPGLAEPAIEAAFAEVGEIHRRMSFHDPDSELSRLNAAAHRAPQAVSGRLRRVLSAALALARASGGSFDPAVGGDPGASWRDVELGGDGRVRFRRPLRLDLGGIAKGYAVDRAIDGLRRQGIAAAVVNAGGDLRSFGCRHTVWVRDPAEPGCGIPLLETADAAVATSAGYFDENALVEPRTGGSLGVDRSATVCARRAIWADGLTKPVLADPSGSVGLLRRLGARAVLLDCQGGRLYLE
ncbi:MAG: FAD:protein FMN transferase [Acidobacteriota bacterium]